MLKLRQNLISKVLNNEVPENMCGELDYTARDPVAAVMNPVVGSNSSVAGMVPTGECINR
jgi:hypothetical protein